MRAPLAQADVGGRPAPGWPAGGAAAPGLIVAGEFRPTIVVKIGDRELHDIVMEIQETNGRAGRYGPSQP